MLLLSSRCFASQVWSRTCGPWNAKNVCSRWTETKNTPTVETSLPENTEPKNQIRPLCRGGCQAVWRNNKIEVVGSIPAFVRFFALRLCSHNFFSVWASRQINYCRGKMGLCCCATWWQNETENGQNWVWKPDLLSSHKGQYHVSFWVFLVYRHSDVTYWINDSILVSSHFFPWKGDS